VPCARLSGEREGLGLDVHESATELADCAIEAGGLRRLEVGKEPTGPGLQMALEEAALRRGVVAEPLQRQPRHDLAEDRDVILRFADAFAALDAEPHQILAQPRERAFMKKASEIIGRVGQQLATPETDEQGKMLALDGRDIGLRRPREVKMRHAEHRRIATQTREIGQCPGCGRRRQKTGQKTVFLGARTIQAVHRRRALALRIKIRTQHLARDPRRGFHSDDAIGRDT